MKYFIVFVSLVASCFEGFALSTILTTQKRETLFSGGENGNIHKQLARNHIRKLKARGYVNYEDFGAKGDGKTDDLANIVAAHAFANEKELKVKVKDQATYYLGGKDLTAIIKTDTDFGKAKFIIDDREVENIKSSVFLVSSNKQAYAIEGISTLKRNQEKINYNFLGPCLVTAINNEVKHYIRFGLNQDNGSPQTDIFVVDKDGNVDMNAPIIWDFDHISKIMVLPLDEKQLNISGGIFTTIANNAESKYNYYSRNIAVQRSNVLIENVRHYVTGEGDHGAPYGGFFNISDCSNVTVQNCLLTAHKTYETIGSAGKPVSMGSYDLSVSRALNVSFVNCTQTNDITDKTYWGILGSNYCKNLLYDHCKLSRFDAHKGVANATIRNSTLGHMGIKAIGSGTLLIENSTIYANDIVSFRSDYGSTWQGELIIRNCKFIPGGGANARPALIGGYNSGMHDFGYTCYMPEKIVIENLQIDDAQITGEYEGPVIFANFNPDFKEHTYKEAYPYIKTREVHLRNIKTTSSKPISKSNNAIMFEEVKLKYLD